MSTTESPNDLHRRALVAEMPALKRAACSILRDRDRAEELTQEALLRVWVRLAEGDSISALQPYLRATLRNLARRPERQVPAELAPPLTAPAASGDRLACRQVLQALTELPTDQLRLLARAALTAASTAEIAAETGLPVGTVASRVSRARSKLRARFDLGETAPVDDLLGR